ncbi:MAG: hypothetical protein ABWY71_02590 [Candidatus Saccharimonadales bacterium]
MSKNAEVPKEGVTERGVRYLRNFKAVGAVALVGAAIALPVLEVPLLAFSAWHVAEAGALEMGRKKLKKRRLAKAAK